MVSAARVAVVVVVVVFVVSCPTYEPGKSAKCVAMCLAMLAATRLAPNFFASNGLVLYMSPTSCRS